MNSLFLDIKSKIINIIIFLYSERGEGHNVQESKVECFASLPVSAASWGLWATNCPYEVPVL
jgi:hypothetical protein